MRISVLKSIAVAAMLLTAFDLMTVRKTSILEAQPIPQVSMGPGQRQLTPAMGIASPRESGQVSLNDGEAVRNAVYNHLDWSSRDHGYNEGALCGIEALQGIAGVELPSIPFEQDLLGNIWDRTNMMGAAVQAYRLGFHDEAVSAAACSQIHNSPAYQLLSGHPDIVEYWLDSH